MKHALLACSLLFLGTLLCAQETTTEERELEVLIASSDASAFTLDYLSAEQWTLHTDQEEKLVYIDLQSLGSQFEKLKVYNQNKELLFQDIYLAELPANSIYEVDCKDWPKGRYQIALETATGEALLEEFALGL